MSASCKIDGTNKDSQAACVCALPCLFGFSKLLAEDLIEHKLLEILSLLTGPEMECDTWNSDGIESMKNKSMLILTKGSENTLEVSSASTFFLYSRIFVRALRNHASGGKAIDPLL